MTPTKVWIPGAAYEIATETDGTLDHLLDPGPERRRCGKGSRVLVPASVELAEWFEREAETWAGPGVDPSARWRVAPCKRAAAVIRQAATADHRVRDTLIHIRARPGAPAADPALCGARDQSTITSAWGYWGPEGAGFDRVCPRCVEIERERRKR